MTTESLASMIQHGFNNQDEKIQRGFEATERNFSEFGQVMKAMLKHLDRIDENVQKLGEVESIKRRLENVEKKVGI